MSELKYQAVIDLSAKNNSHTMAYEYVERVAQGKTLQILEVGCSAAYFGSALKAAGHIVWGIEPNHVSAAVAAQRLDHVFVGIVEDFIKCHPNKKFDVITFGDVLEHIADPSEVLKQCHGLLVEGGAIVASVPNVTHIAIRAMLLDARWEYGDLGILDRTHLRFFTRQTIAELFHDSQYAVIDINAVKLTAETAASASKIVLNPKAVACVEAFASDDYKYDFQYVLLAVPAGTRNGCGSRLLLKASPTRILCTVHDPASSIVDVRLRRPLEAWATACNGEVQFKCLQACDEQSISWADVIIIQRVAEPYSMWISEKANKLGKKVIFEIDDLLIDLPDFLSHHKAGLVGYAGSLGRLLPQVDCVTVTTKRLAKELEAFSRPTVTIPNFTDDDKLGRVNSSAWQDGRATLIVASSDAVQVNFILPAINAVINRTDISISVVVIGPPGDAFERENIKVDRVPNMAYAEFKKFIRTIDNPIGVIPLDDSLFSSCKSPIKYFDYSLAGIPVICSNVPPYSDVLVDGVTGHLVDNEPAIWIAAIEALAKSAADRILISDNALTFVKNNYSLENSVQHWDVLFHTLWCGGFGHNKPFVAAGISRKISYLKFLLAHVFRYKSYKAAARILKRDGIKEFSARFIHGWF